MCDLDHVHSQSGISTGQPYHTSGPLLTVPRQLLDLDEHQLERLPGLEWIDGNHAMDTVHPDRSAREHLVLRQEHDQLHGHLLVEGERNDMCVRSFLCSTTSMCFERERDGVTVCCLRRSYRGFLSSTGIESDGCLYIRVNRDTLQRTRRQRERDDERAREMISKVISSEYIVGNVDIEGER